MELAMPAGTITEALIALNAGADAVYFGMKEFSARKGAGNFSIDDLRKIRKYAQDRKRKTYITINTLIDDRSLPEAYSLLESISDYGTDGIIVQDLGIARLIKRDFPTLPLHGSTQLAVHTEEGVRMLQELGFERAVLSRELTLDEIGSIRKACPDIELKVFIHGALCYGFSGLCMASHIITERSANEGACAQICRTWFRDEDTGRKFFPFSMEDLDGLKFIRKLDEIGIDSLKVEGRMKGPEYAEAVTRYYRAAIDGNEITPDLLHGVDVSFRRKHGTGFMESSGPGHHVLTTGSYTGHTGEIIGTCTGSDGDSITVRAERKIRPHDGLMFLIPDAAGLDTPLKFSASVAGTRGDTYRLRLNDAGKELAGLPLHMISDSSLNTKIPSSDIPMAKRRIPARITVNDEELTITTENLTESYPVETQPSDKSPEAAIQRIFSSSDHPDIALLPEVIETGKTFYINPSRLKEIRREFINKIASEKIERRTYRAECMTGCGFSLPPRSAITGKNTPWNTDGTELDGILYITLPPVRLGFDEKELWASVLEKAETHGKVRIGMNNISDLVFAKAHPELEFFADIYLYLSNREAAELVKEMVPSLTGGYLWLERKSYEEPWPFEPTIVDGFTPPLFISRACIRHDGFGEPCSTCPGRNGVYNLEQNGRHYKAVFHECMTIVSEK